MVMDYIVYKITNKINEKAYIGFTSKSLKERWRKHCIDAKSGRQTFLCNAIRKYGPDTFDLEILYETLDIEEARDHAENKFIMLYETLLPEKGYNMTKGGEGTMGHKHSPETRAKMSNSRKGKRHTLETKLKLSEQRKGPGNPNYGKNFDQEYRDKISRVTKGALNPRAKKYQITDPEGNTFEIEDRMGFCKEHNLNYSSVASCTRKGRPYRGYIFKEITGSKSPRSS
jgi:group I intron endonuclease